MKSLDELDPTTRKVCELVQLYTAGEHTPLAGPIVPRWLAIAMPQIGKRRSHMNFVAIMVLAEILSAYLPKRGRVFWRKGMYQIDHDDLAKRLGCDPGDISTALTHLVDHGLIERTHRANKRNGAWAGKAAFVRPVVPKLVEILTQAKCRSEAFDLSQKDTSGDPSEELESPLKDTPNDAQGDVSLKCAGKRTKAAEAGASRASRPARAPHGDETATASAGFGAPEALKNNNGTQPGQTPHTTPPQAAPSPERQADRFITLWKEAIQRTGFTDPYVVSSRDRRAVLDFFTDNPDFSVPLLASYAILAWVVADDSPADDGRDPFYACRDSLTARSFIHHLNDVRAELQRAKKNRHAYPVLRWYFLDSELEQMGLGQLVLDNLGRDHNRNNFWEHYNPEHFERYYTEHGLPVPDTGEASAN